MPNGNVNLTILDGGASSVIVPGNNIQAVIGTCAGGTALANQVIATANPNTVTTVLGRGQLPEYAALAIANGATILAVKATQTAAGTATSVVPAAGNYSTSPIVVTVTLDGIYGAYDDYYVLVETLSGSSTTPSTIAGGFTFQVSLDAGRNFGPPITTSPAQTSYVIPNTGITLNFLSGTNTVAGDIFSFGTVAPATNTAGIQSALLALQASAYAVTGWSLIHILGKWTGANATAIEGFLDTFANPGYIFTRGLLTARDASPASKWGGSGETEASWMTSIQTDFAAVSAKRLDVGAGYYNEPSAYPNPAAGLPSYRRPGQWAAAVRQVGAPPQRHAGRVSDGVLSNIVVDPTNDPGDGFIYHDERLTPGLDASRFTSFRTRIRQPQGYFVVNPNLMSPLGSDFSILPFGNVMDIACDITSQVGATIINEDIRLNTNGTILENDAKYIEATIAGALNAQMFANNMVSQPCVVAVDRTNNVAVQKKVNISITIFGKGYVEEADVSIGFNNSLAA